MYGAPTITCKPTNNGTSKFGCHAITNKLSFLNRKIKKTVFKKITFNQATPCDVVEYAYQWYGRSDVPCCNMHDATQRHIAMKLVEKFVSIVLEQASKSIPIAMQKSPINHIVSHRQYEMFFHTSS